MFCPRGSRPWRRCQVKWGKKVVGLIMRVPKAKKMEGVVTSSGLGDASIYHALVVIFLEFFAWGLLTSPMITVLNQTFPDHTFLMNGLILGIKGILSFLSAPLIGALSDIWGRKFFSPRHSLLHLCSHTPDEDQPLVVLCYALHLRSVCCNLQCGVCIRF